MKKLFILLSLFAVSILMINCNSEKGESNEAMVKAADDLDKKFAEAFTKGDTSAIMEMYWNSPELVSFSPDGVEAANWEKAKKDMATMFESMKGAKLEIKNMQNKPHGDLVLGHGYWTLTLADSAGTKINGRYTDVKVKKDGKWVYIMDHASVPLAPPQ